MKKNKKSLPFVLAGCLFLCLTSAAIPAAFAKTKTVKSLIVKSLNDSKREIKAVRNGHTYTIDADRAKLRKESSGSKTLRFSDIKKGDVLNVKGTYDDYGVTASEVRDLSTTKKATFYGVVSDVNNATQTVKIETPKRGKLTIALLGSTKVTYDGKKRKFSDIREDDKVLVRGTWNKSKKIMTKTKNFDILVRDDYDKLD